ncbi:hypothetical protein K450DRAFT_236400 [Umbelopsis ramanniana AG]|uniref:Uncharacterized protein n=1 Tax=Umbelopsis ramanniana AG TaxID=1314678 RepID=A0AAD5EAX0_UMBRA|nr:uncharacterized protein K450DRAFT_236400 [Umbelopsis ramanniana AG]KAI8580603.1 hypothetical protein K450DRAFT_236400 [Umbelopsis ramanniana AG]
MVISKKPEEARSILLQSRHSCQTFHKALFSLVFTQFSLFVIYIKKKRKIVYESYISIKILERLVDSI